MTRKRLIYLVLGFLGVVAGLIGIFPHHFLVFTWHVYHCEDVVYKNVKLKVPNEWFVESDSGDVLTLLRVPLPGLDKPIALTVRAVDKIGVSDEIQEKVESFCEIKKFDGETTVGGSQAMGFLCKEVSAGNPEESFWYLVMPDKNIVITSSNFKDQFFREVKNANFEVLGKVKWLN